MAKLSPSNRECRQYPAKTGLEFRRWHIQAPDVQEDGIAQAQALPWRRHRPQHCEVPEEDLQQQRDVAEDFDVEQCQLGDQPVF